MSKDPSVQVAFRLPTSLVKRIDAYAARLGTETPGIEYTRADAARALLSRALEIVEAQTTPAGKPRAGR